MPKTFFKNTVTCDVGTMQYEIGTIKCEKKNKRTTECDKSTIICDVGTVQCESSTIKCVKKIRELSNVAKVQSHVMLVLRNVRIISSNVRKK